MPEGAHTGALRAEDLCDWLLAEEARGISGHTLRVQCWALSSYYGWLKHTGYAGPCPLDDVKPPRRPWSERKNYTDAEANAIYAAARTAGLREDATRREQFDYAVLATLRYAGLRHTDVLLLRLQDLDTERRLLRVDGKGGRIRTVPAAEVLLEVLRWYLTEVRPYCPPSKRLFANPNAQRAQYMGLTGEKVIERITHRYGRQAEVAGPHMPHRWRHTYATQVLRKGVDLHTL